MKRLNEFLLIIMCLIYLFFAWSNAHNKWSHGITKEEEIREERIIW